MFRNAFALGSLALIGLAAACQANTEAPTAGPQPAPAAQPASSAPAANSASSVRSTRDGIYTVAQAERGEQVFKAVCSECHEPDNWTEAAFKGRWAGKPVYQLFYQIHNTMPYGAPSSLTRQQYADVVAYILKLNGLPAGGTELGSDDDSLDAFDIHWSEAR